MMTLRLETPSDEVAAAEAGTPEAPATCGRARRRWLGPLVVAQVVLAVIAAIAVPNWLNAVQRGRQKRTMSDLRRLGTAVESYKVDNGFVPRIEGEGAEAARALAPFLAPTFCRELPVRDGWGNPYRWSHRLAGGYTLSSAAKDGAGDGAVAVGATTDFARDLYYSDGQFTAFPDGTMR